MRRRIILLAAPALAYLLLLGLVAALYVQPPTLGWIGFGVVAVAAGALTAGAVVLFPRMRSNPARPAAAAEPHVLVLADATCGADALCESLLRHLHGSDAAVRVVSPVLPSPLHYLTGDERREHDDAQRRLDEVLAALRRRSLRAHGAVGADDPVQALDDALEGFPATDIVIAAPASPHWLEADVLAHARTRAPHVERLTV